jgi:hypothetical protein
VIALAVSTRLVATREQLRKNPAGGTGIEAFRHGSTQERKAAQLNQRASGPLAGGVAELYSSSGAHFVGERLRNSVMLDADTVRPPFFDWS